MKNLYNRSNKLCPSPNFSAWRDFTVAGNWAGSPTNKSLLEPNERGIRTSNSLHCDACTWKYIHYTVKYQKPLVVYSEKMFRCLIHVIVMNIKFKNHYIFFIRQKASNIRQDKHRIVIDRVLDKIFFEGIINQ